MKDAGLSCEASEACEVEAVYSGLERSEEGIGTSGPGLVRGVQVLAPPAPGMQSHREGSGMGIRVLQFKAEGQEALIVRYYYYYFILLLFQR